MLEIRVKTTLQVQDFTIGAKRILFQTFSEL